MEVNEILDAIRYNKGRFAREATLAAIEKREEITPHLLGILEETIRDAHRLAEETRYMAHMYAVHLLAQFREHQAYPLLARLFSIPGEVVDQLWGDFLTEGLGLVLASVAHRDPGLIQQLIENREAFIWARVGAVRAIPAMVGAQELSREAALAYFQELLQGKLERQPREEVGDIWSTLVGHALDLHPEEIYEDIEKACRRKLVHPVFITLAEIDRRLELCKEETLRALPEKHPLITDAIAEMHWWACFEDEYKERQKERKKHRHRPPPPLPAKRREPPFSVAGSAFRWDRRDGNQEPAAQTILRDRAKVGRNDPCHCGSGRKYKKCCGIREHA